ncbi:MAG TPA: ABC transporter ATP-binding protein [Alphaproteobacteria bacterium]|nr:ABC transporter ATP-binding protein [Alphaproteobacteria bacterium]
MLVVDNLRKTFEAQNGLVNAVDGVSFTVESGKLLTLLGPSGCGKTTTLRCIAGLERPGSGRITIDGGDVYNSDKNLFVPPNERGIGMVFQSYAIWPHMTVFENVAFPLRVSKTRKYSRTEVAEKVKIALEKVRLGGYEERAATQLSGGQQQRLALARGLVREPGLLLLDEPLSNLDAKLREQMRFELKRLQLELGVTTLYVTHDQAEALALSDEILVMSGGKVMQRGNPTDIYRRPNSEFVADFIGSTNLIPGKVDGPVGADGKGAVRTDEGVVRCSFFEPISAGADALVSVRPEDISIAARGAAQASSVLAAKVENRVFLGEVIDYIVRVGSRELRVRAAPEQDFPIGTDVALELSVDRCVGLRADNSRKA